MLFADENIADTSNKPRASVHSRLGAPPSSSSESVPNVVNKRIARVCMLAVIIYHIFVLSLGGGGGCFA